MKCPTFCNTQQVGEKQKAKKQLLRETGGVIRPVEVLKHDNISMIEEEFEGG